MPVDVQGAGQFRRGSSQSRDRSPAHFLGRHPDSGLRAAPQTTDFGNAVQPQQLAQLTGGLALQLLDGLDAAHADVGQQDDHVQRAVVAAQLNKAIVDMSNRPFSARAGKAQSTPPKETSRQGSKWVGAPSRRPNAARTRWSGRCTPCPFQPRHLRRPEWICLWQWAAGEWRLYPVLSPPVRVGRARSVVPAGTPCGACLV